MIDSKNYFFKSKDIKISIFNAETETIAWERLRQTLKTKEDSFEREMPKVEDFEIKLILG